MQRIHGICKECGGDFFVASENCGTDESLCEFCFNTLQEMEKENKSKRMVGRNGYKSVSYTVKTGSSPTTF